MSLNANIERVSWEPGTGTRYDLLLASYKREDSVWLALTWLFKGGSGGVTMTWDIKSTLHWGYMAEKMDVNRADAAGMLAFVRAKGFLVQMPPDFNKDGRWAPKLTAVQA